jgi:anion-transporting  ArsA/GET3 family ATPase
MNGLPTLSEMLRRRSVVVCVGAGGVGKTTLAAALAVRAAALGRSALVCTIDPARRLANALGLQWLGNAPSEVRPDVLAAAGIPVRARLQAMMLDLKASWDELIEQQAPPAQREKILRNRFYQSLSTVLAGSQEYIALEKLWQLRQRSEAELIVLDTPPTAHALDFLDAPTRILDFLDNDAARWLLDPALRAGRLSLKLLQLGGGAARTIGRITGTETLEELVTFLIAVSGMNEGFRERARAVRTLLASPDTGFVLVAGASPERRSEALSFHEVLGERGLQRDAVVVNRVQPPPPASAEKELASLSSPALAKLLRQTLDEARGLAARDQAGVEALRQGTTPIPFVSVPRFSSELHDLRALWRAGAYLVGEPDPEAAAGRHPGLALR